jgi:ATP-dependent DNA helicase DinG
MQNTFVSSISEYQDYLHRMGLKSRAGQIELIRFICSTLANNNKRIGIVDAGTGTGKTLAYMIAGITQGIKDNKKVIISTSTTNLQSQIVNKDIPDLIRSTGLKFKYKISKGRSQYACPKALFNPISDNSLKATSELLINQLDNNNWNGDKDTLTIAVDNDVFNKISSTPASCSGPSCEFYDNCPYMKERGKVEDADVIIANHSLLLADMSLGGGVLLPDPRETIYLLDEFHNLHSTYLSQMACSFNPLVIKKEITVFKTTLFNISINLADVDELTINITDMNIELDEINNELSTLMKMVIHYPFIKNNNNDDQICRFRFGATTQEIIDLSKTINRLIKPTLNKMNEIKNEMNQFHKNKIDKDWVALNVPKISGIINLLEVLKQASACFAKQDIIGELPLSRWISKKNNSVRFNVSPVTAGKGLSRNFWTKCYSVIGLSATAAINNDFTRMLEKNGLDLSTPTISIESPFDYSKQSKLHMPVIYNPPTEVNAFIDETSNWLNENLALHKSSLVLFTSWKALKETVDQISLKDVEVLIQGSENKPLLLDRHKNNIKNNKTSVIFATQGFYEGVDLPGDFLTHVVITKIPFDSPVIPSSLTLHEHYKAQWRNPFIEITLPDAITKMIQASGRLIRKESDYGVVTILDNRIKTKMYGSRIVKSLPNFELIKSVA